MRKTVIVAVLLVCVLMAVAGCAAGPNALEGRANESDRVAGFWRGLWHGIIAPITFVVSLFSKSVGIYEVYNNGAWYNFGFMLGIAMSLGGGSGGACARRWRRRDE
jgi:hypothetical protein